MGLPGPVFPPVSLANREETWYDNLFYERIGEAVFAPKELSQNNAVSSDFHCFALTLAFLSWRSGS